MTRTQLEKLRRRAIRTAVRRSRKLHHSLSRDEILSLRVQVTPGSVRILCGLLGLALILAACFTWPWGSLIAQVLEWIAGIFFLLFAIFGIRRTLRNTLDSLESFNMATELLDSIISALDI